MIPLANSLTSASVLALCAGRVRINGVQSDTCNRYMRVSASYPDLVRINGVQSDTCNMSAGTGVYFSPEACELTECSPIPATGPTPTRSQARRGAN